MCASLEAICLVVVLGVVVDVLLAAPAAVTTRPLEKPDDEKYTMIADVDSPAHHPT
jgi:hypothetical protein